MTKLSKISLIVPQPLVGTILALIADQCVSISVEQSVPSVDGARKPASQTKLGIEMLRLMRTKPAGHRWSVTELIEIFKNDEGVKGYMTSSVGPALSSLYREGAIYRSGNRRSMVYWVK